MSANNKSIINYKKLIIKKEAYISKILIMKTYLQHFNSLVLMFLLLLL